LIKNSQPFGKKCQKTEGGIFLITLYIATLLQTTTTEQQFQCLSSMSEIGECETRARIGLPLVLVAVSSVSTSVTVIAITSRQCQCDEFQFV